MSVRPAVVSLCFYPRLQHPGKFAWLNGVWFFSAADVRSIDRSKKLTVPRWLLLIIFCA